MALRRHGRVDHCGMHSLRTLVRLVRELLTAAINARRRFRRGLPAPAALRPSVRPVVG
jgi:hypothetical protein